MEKPFFSIIIPTYNRPERLATCLESLTHLNYPRHCFEVIVVDDGSSTSLESVVTPFYQQLDITLLGQKNSGPATARNTGAKQAKGKFLAFTDDDCTLTSEYLHNLEKIFATNQNTLIGGRTLNALSDNIYSTASQLLVDYLYNYYNTGSKPLQFFSSNNFSLPAESFHALCGFDTSFPLAAAEDREFCDRWLNHGYKMIYAPEIIVYHAHELTLSKFWRQHFNYGRGAFCFHKARSRRQSKPIKVEPPKFYLNLLTYPLSKKNLNLLY